MPAPVSGTPLNDALNRPKRKVGIDWRILLAITATAAIAAMAVNLVLGVALLAGLPPAVHHMTRRDPQLFQLWAMSFLQRAYYDPGKLAR